MNAIRLYARYVGVSLRSQMQYPGSFIATSLGAFASTITDFIAIWALFTRFRQIEGWQFADVAMLYGTISIAFAFADALTRGFDIFGEQFVKTGDFDRLLVRPRSTVLQLLGYELRATRVGRLAQGVLVLWIGAHLSVIHWTLGGAATIAFAVLGGIALFSGILVLQGTLAFWTVESLEIVNALTYGGVEAAQYPMDIYARWFRSFVTFVVPLASVSYFPVSAVLGRSGADVIWWRLTPAFGFLFFALSLLVWRFGVRRYTSTGS
jgi:ABC-2 type transport system permease protein